MTDRIVPENEPPNDLFESMFRHATVGIVMVDEQGVIIQVNDHATRIFGYSAGELVGAEIEQLVPSDAHHRHVNYRNDYFEHPRPRPMGIGRELFGVKKDGSSFPVEVSLSNARMQDRRVAIAFVSDISVRQYMLISLKENERQLQEYSDRLEQKVIERTKELTASENRLQEAQRMASLGYWEYDLVSKRLSYSDVLLRIFGLPDRSRIRINTFSSLIHPDDYPAMEDLATQVMADSRASRREYNCRIVTAAGQTKYVQGYLEKNSGETPSDSPKLFGITQDITAYKEAERLLALSLQKEREVSALKSRFVAMASHEFRTPLTSILSSTDLIGMHAENMGTPKFDRHLKRIQSSVNNLTSILDDLLSLDKLESGSVSHRPEPVNVPKLFTGIIDEMNLEKTDRRRILLRHKGPETATLDPQLIRNILMNLLSNAVKYAPGDSEIIVASTQEETQLKLSVTDSGIGIPEADQSSMFNRFFRASNAESIKGTGLGLTIVKRYLDTMDGKISFTSAEGEGTTFKLEIPQPVK